MGEEGLHRLHASGSPAVRTGPRDAAWGAKATPGVAGSGLGPGDDQADGDEGDSQRHLRPAEPGPATRQGGQIRPQRDASDDPVQAGQ